MQKPARHVHTMTNLQYIPMHMGDIILIMSSEHNDTGNKSSSGWNRIATTIRNGISSSNAATNNNIIAVSGRTVIHSQCKKARKHKDSGEEANSVMKR